MAKPFTTGCRVCGRDDDRLRRGLCQAHYRRFMLKRKSFATEALQQQFERDCIAQGWLEEKQQGRRSKEADPFDAIAASMVAEMAADFDAAVARDKQEQAAEELRRKTKQPPKPRGRRKAE